MMNFFLLSLSLTLCAIASGCGESDTVENELDIQILEGCKHLKYGNSVALDTREMAQTAPSIHARYDVTLAASSNMSEDSESVVDYSGIVNFESMGGTHVLFLSQMSSVQITNSTQETVPPILTDTPSQSCEEAAIIVVIELPAGLYSFIISDAPHATLELAIHAFDADHSHADHGNEGHEEHGDQAHNEHEHEGHDDHEAH